MGNSKLSLPVSFFPEVRFYQRGDFVYFINTKSGTWVALPKYHFKILFSEQCSKIYTSQYIAVYEALARNNIIWDFHFNQKNISQEIKPLLVKLQTTGKCNLNCQYCFNDLAIRDKTMSRETMHQAVDYCFKNPFAHKKRILFVVYGGEPLLERKILFETVQYIRQKSTDAYIGVITNATLLSENDIVFFKENKVNIIISFDGLPEFQAQNRHGTIELSGAKQVLRNMMKLHEHNYMYQSCVLCTVTRNMSSSLLKIVLFLQAHGVVNLEFLPLRMLGTAEGQVKMATNIGAFVKSLKEITEAIETGQIQQIRMRNILRLLMPLETLQTVKGEVGCHRCSAGRNSIAINFDGSILGCDMIPENISPIIGDVWNGINFLDKLDKLILPYASDNCKKCLWFQYCRGGCIGACASDNGNINSRHVLTCAINKEMYPYLLEKLATDNGKLREYFNRSIDSLLYDEVS